MFSDRRALPTVPSHGCDALTQPVRHTTSLSPAPIQEAAAAVRGTMVGIGGFLSSPRLWSVLNVVMPEQTTALGVRAVEGCLGNGLFPMYAIG